MPLELAFELMMMLTSGCALLVSAWLFWRARNRRSMKALAGFGVMMALWCAGHVAVFYGWHDLGMALILANPLMPTFFLDFAIGFVNQGPSQRPWLSRLARYRGLLYGAAVLVSLVTLWRGGGDIIAFGPFEHYFVFRGSGWFNIGYTIFIGVLAHALLLWGFVRQQGNRRRSIAAMFAAGAWGLWLATSFIFPSLGLLWYPWPMLLLPSYVLLLVYGVVRYQMLEVNAWANRALLWILMTGLLLGLMALFSAMAGRLGMQALAAVPQWQLWLYSLLLLMLALALYQPVSKLVERLIYPGSRLDEQLLETWLAQLRDADGWNSLAGTAQQLLARQMGQPVTVRLLTRPPYFEPGTGLELWCLQLANGWQFRLKGFDDVTPGMRLTAEVFGSLLATRCGLLERSLQLAEAERKRVSEQHLVELGGLSAAMAHELRNPLNIISMATAGLDADRKAMIQGQLKRADRLIVDMLAYSGQLQIQPRTLPLAPLLDSLRPQFDWQGVQFDYALPPDYRLYADPYRLQQVLINLVDNALSFVRNQADGQLKLEATATPGVLWLHNNGPAIEADLQARLFRPFVTQRQGGSGLGLAIVQRIMEAHGGHVRHRNDAGWPVTFELYFPEESTS
ncbi:integral membrane sensor signal transduction histidine kinase [Oceanimonas sp. GK1]|uniref:sensor histidine kinase n=1 Tax=Oceanimonas sp. (strain GK1 / IBRC-M 10197) TaxID=511062 RepID=UPI0002494FDE|nr:sensor histidine kinase [Oceanimonas sp. GK1]AEY02664.1 integral membrane sensor signal transduction histidine kinase [Oceanimonas sp. GK1]